jgi:outer membrane protein assembly factor BamA
VKLLAAFVLLGLGFPSLLSSQNRRAAPAQSGEHRLIAVNVVGTQHYTPEQIMAATDLHIGDTVSDDVFNRAVQTLGESGVFTNVAFTYSYSAAGTKLELQVADNDKLVPTKFENFVWLSDDALLNELRRRVPLFEGKLPLSGNLADRVSDALQAILLQNNIPGHADYIRSGPEDGPVDSYVFSVSNVDLKIHKVTVEGASPAELSLLQEKAQRMIDGDYSRIRVETFSKRDLLPILLARGYLRAVFAPPQVKVQQQTPDETLLDLTLHVDPGQVYRVAGFEWSGNDAVPSDKLNPLLHLVPNQPANGVQLGNDLEEVRKVYGTRGFVKASVTPEPQFDDSKGTVSYRLVVHQGEVYLMGDLDIRGLDSRTISQLREQWTLAKGTPYDASYPKRFTESAWKLLAPQVDWTVKVHEATDDSEKTVDISLVYGIRASR